jgi:hypothetical protein
MAKSHLSGCEIGGSARARVVGALLGFAAMACLARGQQAITIINTSVSDSGNHSTNGTTFDNTTLSVNKFYDASGNFYSQNSTAITAYVRRDTTAGNADNSSVWYTDGSPSGSSPGGSFGAPYASSYGSLLLGNNVLRGSDNTFANGTDATSGDIERLDFYFGTGGMSAVTSNGFAVFDRGVVDQHDNVKIAVITGWDSVNNQPTSYGGNLINITSTDYGTVNPIADFDYNLFRYDNGDNLGTPYWNSDTETGTQGIGGVVISLADLGIAAGTTIYGYSLMGYDVTTGGNINNLVDWNNTTYYSTTTDGTSGAGGIDLSAVNGVLYTRTAPEPSTYGALFVGAMLAVWCWRRRRTGLERGCLSARAA